MGKSLAVSTFFNKTALSILLQYDDIKSVIGTSLTGISGYIARTGKPVPEFLVSLTPGWADVIWFPRFKLGFPSDAWAPEAGLLFFFHWKSFVRFPYQRQEKHEWVCRRLSEGLPLQSDSGFCYFVWQSRVSQGIPSSNVLDAAVRKTRKAVQEEKHVPPRCVQNIEENLRQWTRGNPFRPFSRG